MSNWFFEYKSTGISWTMVGEFLVEIWKSSYPFTGYYTFTLYGITDPDPSRDKQKQESRKRKRENKIGSKLFTPTAWTADPSQRHGLQLSVRRTECILVQYMYMYLPATLPGASVRGSFRRFGHTARISLTLTLFGERRTVCVELSNDANFIQCGGLRRLG